ncbi:protein of unknown function [Candidatus Methylocalor cossyra]|uniref:Uncharacterized protein n=1 Tax=Candidatus Methylocalor cossyra TaxID=3108543 RepID=A0ABM9NGJ4_9GAMM
MFPLTPPPSGVFFVDPRPIRDHLLPAHDPWKMMAVNHPRAADDARHPSHRDPLSQRLRHTGAGSDRPTGGFPH